MMEERVHNNCMEYKFHDCRSRSLNPRQVSKRGGGGVGAEHQVINSSLSYLPSSHY